MRLAILLLLLLAVPARAWNYNQAIRSASSVAAHASRHKVGGNDSVGAGSTSTAGLLKLGATAGTAADGSKTLTLIDGNSGSLTFAGNASPVGANMTITLTHAFANPSAQVGANAVNGTAVTFMRSDAAPALDQNGAYSFPNLVNVTAGNITATGGLRVTPNGITTVLSNDGSGGYLETQGANPIRFIANSAERMRIFDGLQVGTPTGGDKGAGTINTAGDIYKNNSAYTNPDYVFEKAFTGRIEKYAKRPGAAQYRPMSLGEVEAHARKHLRLPGIEDAPMGMFRRADIALEKIEELYLYAFGLNRRMTALEGMFR